MGAKPLVPWQGNCGGVVLFFVLTFSTLPCFNSIPKLG